MQPESFPLPQRLVVRSDNILHPIRYLLHQLHLAATLKEESIFVPGTQRGLWKLRPDLLFVFFSSHTPCKYINAFGFMLHCLLPYCCLIHSFSKKHLRWSVATTIDSASLWTAQCASSRLYQGKVEGASLILLFSSQFPSRICKLKAETPQGPKPTRGLRGPKPWVLWWFILKLISFIH